MLLGAAGRKLWHIGRDSDEDIFADIPDALSDQPPIERVAYNRAEGIICTGPFDPEDWSPEDYRGKFLSAKTRGLTMLNANPDIVVDYGDKRIHCAGAVAQLYAEMGGQVLSFGKPHPPIYDLARRRLGEIGITVSNDQALAVGDGIHTDIAGAQAEGIDAIFVTGGLEAARFGPDTERPDAAALTSWLDAQQLYPAYAMGQLR
jgi:ribonucleotide monophosphatase NagD (HAD superfamily)